LKRNLACFLILLSGEGTARTTFNVAATGRPAWKASRELCFNAPNTSWGAPNFMLRTDAINAAKRNGDCFEINVQVTVAGDVVHQVVKPSELSPSLRIQNDLKAALLSSAARLEVLVAQ
jgi:hypothetical protein